MNMQDALDAIYARIDKPENLSKKSFLVHHPSDVPSGNDFHDMLDKAREYLNRANKTDIPENSPYYTEFTKTIKSISRWLDDNNWAK